MKEISSSLQDIKLLDGINCNSAIARIMKRYALERGNYENSKYVEQRNKDLGWENYSRDIITPFWKTFCAALVYTSTKYELSKGKWKTKNIDVTYILVENSIRYRTYYDKRDVKNGLPLSKRKLGQCYVEGNDTHQGFVDKTLGIFPELEELAAISDSVSNFAPCPDQPFNSLKGLLPEICDFLNLFVDKIQECVDKHVGLEYDNTSANAENLVDWHCRLIENRERFFLQEYYEIEGEQLRGKPLFQGQSLSSPLPSTEEEVRLCIANELRILRKRAEMF